ncbi:MAG: phenylalanine--tRNA ligase subunit alpha [Mycoplasma sp.]
MSLIDINILKKELSECDNEKKIIECKNIFTKKYIAPLYAKLKVAEDKKEFGLQINAIKDEVETLIQNTIDNLLTTKDPNMNLKHNLSFEVNTFNSGTHHIINSTIQDIIVYLQNFNFQLVSGNEVVKDKYNFDALNIGKNHPAREMHDSLYIDTNLLLRTHCTSTSAIVMKKEKSSKDIRVFSYGNVYRRDEDDATHSHQFTQVDFVWVKKGLNLSNLKFIIDGLIKHLFGKQLDVRYRLSYFPFTEPSFEVDVECWRCKNNGCSICKQSGWIEILGAGMLNQNVMKFAGIMDIQTGIAAGIGVERIAMLKYGVSDIRDFYNNDFEINKQYKR